MPENSEQLKQLLAFLEDSQAIDVVCIDVRGQTTVTDYMIIASGRSSRHVNAIAGNLMEQMKAAGTAAIGENGSETGDWVLVDFGDYVVHIMQPDARSHYNLEELWRERENQR
ncbi:ribosome silencing factor [Legionella sp. CNM-4043-24]|uniref:ribosome silencing factor n=1 Tax=Legionella sp. CNM-4043-24 TaxID=3421646 RepID=UPI00403ADAF3